jgi:hypothetical protein
MHIVPETDEREPGGRGPSDKHVRSELHPPTLVLVRFFRHAPSGAL